MKDSIGTLKIREHVPLGPFTTLGVGGPARYMAEAATEQDVTLALHFAKRENLPLLVLGGGSNLLVSDAGFAGLALKIAIAGVEQPDPLREGRVRVAAGENLDDFIQACVEQDLAGLECLSGIPGTVGATPIQNVGAYGAEVSEVLYSVRVLDRVSENISEIQGWDCRFAYRSSIFLTTERDQYVVLGLTFDLRRGGKPLLKYADLHATLAGEDSPTLKDVRDAVLSIRAAKGMVIKPDDPDTRSLGSFFKNPIAHPETVPRIEQAARRRSCLAFGEKIPQFQTAEGHSKIPAAWLIERAGFPKGYRSGRVGLSTKHALAIVNLGGATAREVVALMNAIQAAVKGAFGIELIPEPTFIGFD